MEEMVKTALGETFSGRSVLVTGHTGFKGAWLALWLSSLGARVTGVALDPAEGGGLYEHLDRSVFIGDLRCDIRDAVGLRNIVKQVRPDYVFHLAAQPLVRLSYDEPLETLTTNILGSAHVLEAVRYLDKTCHTIFVTSDKCYENQEWVYSYRESDRLGGKDPYSMSKAAAELVSECWRRSFFDKHPQGSKVLSVRAGNVIGGGDYSADRIIPDCLRAALSGKELVIRSPKSTRPWQHVLDCLYGYLVAAIKAPGLSATSPAETFNFGPQDAEEHPVLEVAEKFFTHWGKKTPGVRVQAAHDAKHEAGYLAVSIDKAGRLLGWHPTWHFEEALKHTVDWYRACHLERRNMQEYSLQELRAFMNAANNI